MDNKPKIGRPKGPTPTLTDEQKSTAIELAAMGESLKNIADSICVTTQYLSKCRSHDQAFDAIFERARLEGLELIADSLLTIADDIEDVQRARLKSDNFKWLLSKRKPKIYGDKIDVNITERVDISLALSEARARVMRATREALPSQDNTRDVIDITNNMISELVVESDED
ncbi:MAG: hypothetical protein KDA17_00595 [Candidatus Saccharibacteria bacterium]|nr:hypothetical protein [Candidatus Saccharibacteria bacterium]